MKRIAIIGTGKLGTRLTEQLILDQVCSEIFLLNRSPEKLEGVFLSLKIWNSIIPSKTKLSIFSTGVLPEVDLVVISIKENYDPRYIMSSKPMPEWLPQNLRYAGIKKDIVLVRQVCDTLKYFTGIVVVVTNPVDVMTSLVSEWLPKAKVFGLGLSIDAARFSYFLNQEVGGNFKPEDFIFAGEHGSELVALSTVWKTNLRKKSVSAKVIKDVSASARQIGFDIVNKLGYTLQDCAVMFSRDIQWLIGKNSRNTVAFSHWNTECAIGIPFNYRQSTDEIIRYTQISRSEEEEIIKLEHSIKALIDHIYEAKWV